MEEQIKEVYVSIVTLPKLDRLETDTEDFDRFKSTYVEHKEYLNDRAIIQSYSEVAGKSVAFNRIFSIAIGFKHNGIVRVNILNGSEKNQIKEFHDILKSDFFAGSKLYGYGNEFLRDTLSFRARVNGISKEFEAPQFKDISLQPWNRKLSVDLMEETVKSYRGKISFINALYGAGINYSEILAGEDVHTYYQSGNIDRINKHSANYIRGLVNLHAFLETQEQTQQLNFTVNPAKEKLPEDVNMLDHILASGNLNSKNVDLIVEFTEREKLNKENVLLLVKTALSKSGKVADEDIEELKEKLGLSVDYSSIPDIVEKGNLSKKLANAIVEEYKDKTPGEKQEVVNLIRAFLTEKGKINQKVAKESLKFTEEKLCGK